MYKIAPSGTEVVQPDETLGSALHIDCSSPLTHVQRALESKDLAIFILSTPSTHFCQVHIAHKDLRLGVLFNVYVSS